ncbi:MAG: hypothetical protein ACFB0A_06925 [Croceivirga sp.]
MKKISLILLILSFGCSNDDSVTEEEMDMLDLSVISGRYVGEWETGQGPISMEVFPSNSNRYNVNLYIGSNFTPTLNSDGTTPEARGTLIVDGTEASIMLTERTDVPICTGTFNGNGMRLPDGKLQLSMDIESTCPPPAGENRWNLLKISE